MFKCKWCKNKLLYNRFPIVNKCYTFGFVHTFTLLFTLFVNKIRVFTLLDFRKQLCTLSHFLGLRLKSRHAQNMFTILGNCSNINVVYIYLNWHSTIKIKQVTLQPLKIKSRLKRWNSSKLGHIQMLGKCQMRIEIFKQWCH